MASHRVWNRGTGAVGEADMQTRPGEHENGRLKKMVADRDLEIDVKEITRKRW